MSVPTGDALHLPSIQIIGFRGFRELSIPRLGRVTLLAGRNSVGKTTVLDAVRLFAARGRPRVLWSLLHGREELATGLDEDEDPITVPDLSALFHGRAEKRKSCIVVGAGRDELTLRATTPRDWTDDQKKLFEETAVDVDVQALRVEYGTWHGLVPWLFADGNRPISYRARFTPRMRRLFDDKEWPAAVDCESLGPGLPDNDHMAHLWGLIALTKDEDFLVHALRLILGGGVERISVVGNEGSRYRANRRVIVKLKGQTRPVPLKSFGDGATRLFGVALALANCRNGLLVIDEAENGLHYTVHADFWRMVLRAAAEGNAQVLATTHSWDCITGFARAAVESQEVDGVLVRLEQDEAKCKAVVYDEDELRIAADQHVELR